MKVNVYPIIYREHPKLGLEVLCYAAAKTLPTFSVDESVIVEETQKMCADIFGYDKGWYQVERDKWYQRFHGEIDVVVRVIVPTNSKVRFEHNIMVFFSGADLSTLDETSKKYILGLD